jgi:hypothetical protein
MDIASLVHLVVYLIIIGCIVGALLYLVSISPVPEPFRGWLWFAVMAIAILIVIFYVLLPMAGGPPSFHMGR